MMTKDLDSIVECQVPLEGRETGPHFGDEGAQLENCLECDLSTR